MRKKEDTSEGKRSRCKIEQCFVCVTFDMLSHFGKPSFFESYGENRVSDLVEKMMLSQVFLHRFFKDKE